MYLPKLQPQALITKQHVAGHEMRFALLVDSWRLYKLYYQYGEKSRKHCFNVYYLE